MAQTVDRVERERRGEDRLARVFDALREACDNLDDSRAVERRRRDEVCDREAVQDWRVQLLVQRRAGHGWESYARTLRPAPVTRLAMDASHVSCGW